MALPHFTVDQTKRSEGQSAIVSAAYRSGKRLYNEYYDEYSDYTRKGGVTCSDILLPSHAPPGSTDHQTLWNAVEQVEQGEKAQLTYSFEITLQNESIIEEDIVLAGQFLLNNSVSRDIIIDMTFHEKETEDGGIPNSHFHSLYPMCPMNSNGTRDFKQHRVHRLDEDGSRIRDQNGKFLFDAVPTINWGSPETLEYWRKVWADVCNARFEEKGLDIRIDHHGYLRQGVDLLPTVHEDATVRAMEEGGIRTERGEFNRWIRVTNAVIWDIRRKIAFLPDWVKEIEAELAKPQTPDLAFLLRTYYFKRSAGAHFRKSKISDLKEMNETFSYLRKNGIYTLEDLKSRVESHRTKTDNLKTAIDTESARMKAIRSLSDDSSTFQRLKPVYEGLRKVEFDKPRTVYEAEHEAGLKQFYTARRGLAVELPDGEVNMKKSSEGCDALVQTHTTIYERFKSVREDLQRFWKVKSCADTATRFMEHTGEQILQNQPQTRHKKEDISL